MLVVRIVQARIHAAAHVLGETEIDLWVDGRDMAGGVDVDGRSHVGLR